MVFFFHLFIVVLLLLFFLLFLSWKRRLRTIAAGEAEANRIMPLTVALPSYYVYLVSFFLLISYTESSCGKWSNVPM
jgi:hypothetical protein